MYEVLIDAYTADIESEKTCKVQGECRESAERVQRECKDSTERVQRECRDNAESKLLIFHLC